MGVYISNMEMPKNGSCIQIVIDDDGEVYPSVEKCILKMGSIAKAATVPPHGRLGDLDKLALEMMEAKNADQALAMVDDAPTIIEADDLKEER